jgi:hypothetical protein
MSNFTERFRLRPRMLAGAVALLGVGGAIGAGVMYAAHPVEAMAPAAPVPIAQLAEASRPWAGDPIVAVRGRVAGIYGGQFLLNDGTGQVLVEAGPGRNGAGGLAQGEALTVQGGYRDGVIHASYLVNQDGRVAAVGGPGRHGPDHGPGAGPDPRHDPRDGPPAPPPPAAAPAPAPAASAQPPAAAARPDARSANQ